MEPLIRVLLTDESRGVRVSAARALKAFKDPRAVSAMLQLLKTGPLPHPKTPPIITANRAILDAVTDLLDNPEKDVAQAAYDALRRMTGQDFGDSRRGWSRWVSANVGG